MWDGPLITDPVGDRPDLDIDASSTLVESCSPKPTLKEFNWHNLNPNPWADADLVGYLETYHHGCFIETIRNAQHDKLEQNTQFYWYYLPLSLDLALLVDWHPPFGNVIFQCQGSLSNGLMTREEDQQVYNQIFSASLTLLNNLLEDDELVVNPEQLTMTITLETVPTLPECTYPSVAHFQRFATSRPPRLVILRGLVTAVWLPTKFPIQETLGCTNRACRDRHFCHYRPQGPSPNVIQHSYSRDSVLFSHHPRGPLPGQQLCPHCRMPMVALVTEYKTRYCQYLCLTDRNPSERVPGSLTGATVLACLPQPLVGKVHVGEEIRVAATLQRPDEDKLQQEGRIPEVSTLAHYLRQGLRDHLDPASGLHTFPLDSGALKLLLCSLVSVTTVPQRRWLHLGIMTLYASAEFTRALKRLCGQLIPNFTWRPWSNPLRSPLGTLRKTESPVEFIQDLGMSQANAGVLIIQIPGNISKDTQRTLTRLLNENLQGWTIENENHHVRFQSECFIWWIIPTKTRVSPHSKGQAHATSSSPSHTLTTRPLPVCDGLEFKSWGPFIDKLDHLMWIDTISSSPTETPVTNSAGQACELHTPEDALYRLKFYLAYCRQTIPTCDETTSSPALNLIRCYYSRLRSWQSKHPRVTEAPARLLQTLTTTMLAHARLDHHGSPTTSDALFSIQSMENTLRYKYGQSMLDHPCTEADLLVGDNFTIL
ncbi:hypothetical protein IWQ61_007331 [Dispira simplex]|nr:hypothetical protein IWQ61_007331 [Dispira simplex]